MKSRQRNAPHVGNRIVLDASILLLLVVGTYDPKLLGKIKHAKAYVPEDYALLLSVIEGYRCIWVTPNALTEVSNLLGKGKDQRSEGMAETLRDLIGHFREQYVPSKDAAAHSAFLHLGLADSALIEGFEASDEILTTDASLYSRLSGSGRQVTNFNHLRPQHWTS